MKIIAKNGCDSRPIEGEFSTTSLIELVPDSTLSNIPANVVLLIDASSSMHGSKWNTVKEASIELIDSLKDDDRVAIILFDSSAKEVFPLASLSQNRSTMKEAIQKWSSPQGVTNLEEGLKKAYLAFDARSSSDRVKRVNHVILLTDGFPTDDQGYRMEKTTRYEEIVKKHEHVTLTGIGIGSADDYDATFIGKLSDLGRGSYYHANDLNKFKEGLEAEIQKLQSSVVGELKIKFSNVRGKIMRMAKVSPEIVLYDPPGNVKSFEVKVGSMTKDLTSFIVQTNTTGDGAEGVELTLFTVEAIYDDKKTNPIDLKIKTSRNEVDLSQVDPDVFKASQALQVHLNGEQIRLSLAAGDKAKATRLIENTTQIASGLGQKNVTRALTRLADDIKKGKSVSDDLATIQDASRKTRLIIK